MILVLGGTGFVGGHLLARVTQIPSPTRWAVHSPRKHDLMTKLPVETVNVDVRDYASLLAALHGVTAVINLVTVTRELSPSDFAAVHYDGMLNLVQAAQETGVQRIIHVGALGDDLARQDSKRGYLYWKQRATDHLRMSDLNFTVFETSIVFGPGDQHMTAIALALKGLGFSPIPAGQAAQTRFQPVWVGDLVTCLLKALDDPRSIRRTFPLGGPTVLQYHELVKLVGDIISRQPRIVYLQPAMARLILDTAGRFTNYLPVTSAMAQLSGVDSLSDSNATYEHFQILPAKLPERTEYLRNVGLKEVRAWRRGVPVHAAFAAVGQRVLQDQIPSGEAL